MTMRERERERDCRCDYAAKETNLRAIDDRIRPSVKWQSAKKKGPNQKESKTSERRKGEGKDNTIPNPPRTRGKGEENKYNEDINMR